MDRLKETLSITKKSYHTEHYALDDINLDVYKGECVGIIGTNGSGKSTLAKMITKQLKDMGVNESKINAEVKKWLKEFYRRFFTQQFKRSCLPDGPKIGSIGLSPRGDLKMPSDAVSRLK